jgi:ABC-type transport system involved in multi-copper enzyme maturation permease subunit
VFTVTGSGDFRPYDFHDPHLADSTLSVLLFSLPVVIGLGAAFVTGEYPRGLIRTTFAATPRRGRALAAKAVVLGASVFTVELAASTYAVGHAVFNAGSSGIPPASLTDRAAYLPLIGATLLLTALALLALGAGAIVRRAPAAVVLVAGALMIPAILAENLPPGVGSWLVRPLPVAGFSLLAGYDFTTVPQPPPRPEASIVEYPAPWVGLVVLCAWVAAALVAGGWLMRRRDTYGATAGR